MRFVTGILLLLCLDASAQDIQPPPSEVTSPSSNEIISRRDDNKLRAQKLHNEFIDQCEALINKYENRAKKFRLVSILVAAVLVILSVVGNICNKENKGWLFICSVIATMAIPFFEKLPQELFGVENNYVFGNAALQIDSIGIKWRNFYESFPKGSMHKQEVFDEFLSEYSNAELSINKIRRGILHGSALSAVMELGGTVFYAVMSLGGGEACAQSVDEVALEMKDKVKIGNEIYMLHAFDKRNMKLKWFAGVGKDSSLEVSKSKAETSLHKAIFLYIDSLLSDMQKKSTGKSFSPGITENVTAYLISEELETFKSDEAGYSYLVVAGINPGDLEHLLNKITHSKVSLSSIEAEPKPFVRVRVSARSNNVDPDAMTLINTTQFDRTINNVKYYKFVVKIDAEQSVLAVADSVVYHMHSSFSNPRRVSYSRENGFEHTWLGWGVFAMRADVHLHNGNVIHLTHQLQWTD